MLGVECFPAHSARRPPYGLSFGHLVLGLTLTAQYSCASLTIFASSVKEDGFIIYVFAPSSYAFSISGSCRDDDMIIVGMTLKSGWSRIQASSSILYQENHVIGVVHNRNPACP
jgi:hypothetical protein